MTTPRCWGRNTPVRWRRSILLVLLLAGAALPQDAPDAGARALGAGVEALDKGDIPTALRNLAAAQRSLPALADYIAWWTASAHAAAKDHAAVNRSLEPLWKFRLPSPLAGRAAVLGAKAWLETDNPQAALDLLARQSNNDLPQPQARAVEAAAREAAGEGVAAAQAWQDVYHRWPAAPEAAAAAKALVRLETTLGARFPAAGPALRLERADKLLQARQTARARAEYVALAASAQGIERDLARVRIGAADYSERRTQAAANHLDSLRADAPEAEAERLYWLTLAYVRLERLDGAVTTLREMESRFSPSEWRYKALLATANRFWFDNDAAQAEPLYRACSAGAPGFADAWLCHWRAAWIAVLQRRSGAPALLREHLLRFPGSEKASACLYWLGRLAEEQRDAPAARRYFQEIETRFPNHYYRALAQARLGALRAAGASPATDEFLRGVSYPGRPALNGLFTPTPLSNQRIERGRLLERAGLMSWAYNELRFAARTEGPPYVLAIELGEMGQRAGEPEKGLRFLKAHANGFLFLPRQAAPPRFWKLAFPWPYRGLLDYWCRQRGVDPAILAGLIRQESEFDPKIVSYAGAIGLTQVMPLTGRELARRSGIAGFHTSLLKQAEPNVKIGTYYFKMLLDRFEGSVEAVLAGYNGGPTRAARWRGWGPFREPAEFVETIPIDQSREYVQIVLRNAEVYRELYANEPAPAYTPAAPKPPAAKKAAPARKTTPARKKK